MESALDDRTIDRRWQARLGTERVGAFPFEQIGDRGRLIENDRDHRIDDRACSLNRLESRLEAGHNRWIRERVAFAGRVLVVRVRAARERRRAGNGRVANAEYVLAGVAREIDREVRWCGRGANRHVIQIDSCAFPPPVVFSMSKSPPVVMLSASTASLPVPSCTSTSPVTLLALLPPNQPPPPPR